MVETSEVRRRLRAAIARAHQGAADRRTRVAEATQAGERVLVQVVTPVFRAVAGALRAEGFHWRVETPRGAVRLASDGSGSNWIELALETADDPPRLLLGVSRARGRRVVVDERVVREHPEIGRITEDEVLDLIAAELTPFVQ